jgi:hypothetical protein
MKNTIKKSNHLIALVPIVLLLASSYSNADNIVNSKFAYNSNVTVIGEKEVKACGGAWTKASAEIIATPELISQGMINLKVNSNSTAHCGRFAPETFNADIPLAGYSNTIYYVDDQACDGGKWDIGGVVSVNGNGCIDGNCSYDFFVTAFHGGVADQCKQTKTEKFTLSFKRPE